MSVERSVPGEQGETRDLWIGTLGTVSVKRSVPGERSETRDLWIGTLRTVSVKRFVPGERSETRDRSPLPAGLRRAEAASAAQTGEVARRRMEARG